MLNQELHNQMVQHGNRALDWYRNLEKDLQIPFYSSFDIRDAGFKVVNVDGNIYPAGFNNICQVDRENAPDLVRSFLDARYKAQDGGPVRKLMLITEEHTNNSFYWENVYRLREILMGAGLEVCVALPRLEQESATIPTASGFEVPVIRVTIEKGGVRCSCFAPDLIVSNNDFSEYYPEWGTEVHPPIIPPRELGWWQRKKSMYFEAYNTLAEQFARVIEADPWMLTVDTELFTDFDVAKEESRDALAQQVQSMLDRIRQRYAERGVQTEPAVFVKNNSGTYGLAVIQARSGDEVRSWNYKSKKKMKAAKGGREVEEVIVQEGVPSRIQSDGATAEPTLYMFGSELAGGFLRSHTEKGPLESLNSPGAVYKRLCVSDLKVSLEGNPMENVYGWAARLGVLAIGQETAKYLSPKLK